MRAHRATAVGGSTGDTKRGVCTAGSASVMAVMGVMAVPPVHTRLSRITGSDGAWRAFPRSGIVCAGQGHREGGACSNLAVHRDGSPMALDDLSHNVEPHTQTRDRTLPEISSPIEALKNLVALLMRDAPAMVGHPDRDRL